MSVQGWGTFVIKEKLKQLKEKFKVWHNQNYSALCKYEAMNMINELNGQDDLGNLDFMEA